MSEIIDVICVGCQNRFKVDLSEPKFAKCPKCGGGRIWRDNEKTREQLQSCNLCEPEPCKGRCKS